MWVVLLLLPLINAISYNRYDQIILLDDDSCNGTECPYLSYNTLSYYNDYQDSLLFKQTLKNKLYKRCPFWSSGNSGNNDGSNQPLDKTQVAEHYRDKQILTIRKVNVDHETEYSRKFEVTALPTLLFFARGEVFCRVRGVITASETIDIIEKIIANL